MITRWSVVGSIVAGLGGFAIYWFLPNQPADPRIHDESLLRVESRLGRGLYAPTWLPDGMRPVAGGTRIGQWRVLSNFEEPATQRTLIMAQEPREPTRDEYHQTRILPRADLKAMVGSERAYFIRGRSGERRLFWRTERAWLLLSSFFLSDEDLLRVAQSVRYVSRKSGDRATTPAAEGPADAETG